MNRIPPHPVAHDLMVGESTVPRHGSLASDGHSTRQPTPVGRGRNPRHAGASGAKQRGRDPTRGERLKPCRPPSQIVAYRCTSCTLCLKHEAPTMFENVEKLSLQCASGVRRFWLTPTCLWVDASGQLFDQLCISTSRSTYKEAPASTSKSFYFFIFCRTPHAKAYVVYFLSITEMQPHYTRGSLFLSPL